MITEDYCSQEVSKLLEEKGFREYCGAVYFILENGDYSWSKIDIPIRDCGICKPAAILCPTHQMAMKWLREMYNIIIVIEPHMYDYVNERNASYVCSIWVGDNYYENPTSTDYTTFEETVDAALKHVLKNLI